MRCSSIYRIQGLFKLRSHILVYVCVLGCLCVLDQVHGTLSETITPEVIYMRKSEIFTSQKSCKILQYKSCVNMQLVHVREVAIPDV